MDAVTVDAVTVIPAISSASISFDLAFCSGFREDPFEPLMLLSVRYDPGALEALSVDLW